MPTERALRVRGLRELNRAFARADKRTSKELRDALREVAQPVASDAEALARVEIPNIGQKWPRMRVGVTRTLVYVAPRERGVASRANQRKRRPNLATKMMDEAMAPALARHAPDLERRTQHALDTVARDWERG